MTGFAKGSVNDRTKYINTDQYRIVKTEEEFLHALDDAKSDEVEVIEIAADLDLGWDRLSDEAKLCSCITEYGWSVNDNVEVTNPSILESYVSQLMISDTEGLTIFSKSGNTVQHAEWKLQGSSSDIVIRNITFDGMWYFSNSSKDTGWSLLKLNGVKGVWIDHCSTTIAIDGNVDSENGASNVTTSWDTFGLEADESPSTNSMIYKTITYLEEMYQNNTLSSGEEAQKYKTLRDGNASPAQIMAYVAYHWKLSLNGSGEKDFKDGEGLQDGNQRLHITYAYDKAINIGSRFPLIRQGTAHMFNCLVDDSGHMALHNDRTLPFYDNGGFGLNRALDARCGASIGADTCVYNEVRVITDNEKFSSSSSTGSWGWALQNAYNHVLVVNSKVTLSGDIYTGSSWDNDGNNLFQEGFQQNKITYWVDRSTIGDFHWFSYIVNADSDTYERGTIPDEPFTFTYSEGDDNVLPYSYKTVALDDVEDTVNKYAGSYTIVADADFWLRTEYTANDTVSYQLASDVEEVKAESLSLSTSAMTADAGTLRQMDAVVEPSNATNKEVTWTSSDTSIAEVRDSGLVVAKKAGTVTITATTTDGTNISASAEVTVETPAEDLTVSAPTKTLYLGDETTPADSVQLTAEVLPSNATYTSVKWSSTNSKVVSVDENGVLTPHKQGTVTITCTTHSTKRSTLIESAGISKTIRITVKEGANPNATPAPTETPTVKYGDANGDGNIGADDALAVLQHVVGLETLTGTKETAADVDGVKGVTATDALYILQYVVELIDHFPVTENAA